MRSARETLLEVIGKPLDDQLRVEGWNSYSCVDRDEARALLRRFEGEGRCRSSWHQNTPVTCRRPEPLDLDLDPSTAARRPPYRIHLR